MAPLKAPLHTREMFLRRQSWRAAYSLASAKSHLGVLHNARPEEIIKKEKKEDGHASGGRKGSIANEGDYDAQTENYMKACDAAVSQTNVILLEQRFNRLTEQLLAKVRGWFEEILSSRDVAGIGGDDVNLEEDNAVLETGNRRLLQHCVCALQVVGRLDIAEAAVAECVLPHAKATLTQGRVDGAGGRGSFAGLEAALLAVLSKLDQSVLSLLATSEALGCDLVIGGAWCPVTTLISERFPGMFGVGIASVMATCMKAFEAFNATLGTELLGPDYTTDFMRRLALDSRVIGFRARWNLDLYLKLRAQEVRSRMDRACSVCSTSGLVADSLEILYKDPIPVPPSAKPASKGIHGGIDSGSEGNMPLPCTLTSPELAHLKQSLSLPSSPSPAGFNLALTIVCATEAATCLHDRVYFPSLASSLLALAAKCVVRFEAHICLSIGALPPPFPKVLVLLGLQIVLVRWLC